MTQWFGKSWGAPCCAEDEHVATPVWERCSRCREPIMPDDQGMVMPLVAEFGSVERISTHLDCYLKQINPHGPDCPHCRGAERIDHDRDCAYRMSGENCTCIPIPGSKPQ